MVEPIRDTNVLENICNYLKKSNKRNYILFLLGIYTGLRISDILKLKVKDVKNKKYIILKGKLKEQKTNKQKQIEINPILKKELNEYIDGKCQEEYLIKSRENYNKPISRFMAYKILRDIGDTFSIDNLGTHTMRKTFGYHYYKNTSDIVTLQKIFNHSDPSITLHYIGIVQEDINKAYRDFRYFK